MLVISDLDLFCLEKQTKKKVFIRSVYQGFPGGSVAKNLSANARDPDLIPDPGRSYMLWSN